MLPARRTGTLAGGEAGLDLQQALPIDSAYQ